MSLVVRLFSRIHIARTSSSRGSVLVVVTSTPRPRSTSSTRRDSTNLISWHNAAPLLGDPNDDVRLTPRRPDLDGERIVEQGTVEVTIPDVSRTPTRSENSLRETGVKIPLSERSRIVV